MNSSGTNGSQDVELDDGDERGKVKGLVKLTGSGGTHQIGNVIIEGDSQASVIALDGCRVGERKRDIKIPGPPSDWVRQEHQPSRNEPKWVEVDNPGDWPAYCFRPIFASRNTKSKYKHHQLPTGAMPFPKRPEDGKRMTDSGWEFFYKGWKNPDKPYRRGATTANMFPKEMDGCLDANVLKSLGLNKTRMAQCDAAFFLQLVLPFCHPDESGIENDPRLPFFVEEERFTNMSKYESGKGGSYGHTWTATTAKELVNFHGVVIRDGVLGSTAGAIHRRWKKDGICYNYGIANTMTLTRFGELKRNLKLCHNGSVPKRGMPNYDPAYKYDLIYKTMVHNCNAITKKADENQTVDETTWGHAGYGEAGSGLTGRLRNKKVNKGGQTTIMSDSRRFRPRAYIHRHKLHQAKAGMTKRGPNEMVNLLMEIETMVKTNEDDAEQTNTHPRSPTKPTKKKIFNRKPTVCADNFFFDNQVCDWIGKNGFSSIGTTARNILPDGVQKEYLHVEKSQVGCHRAKAARFTHPIVAVKNFDGYQRVHVSFQSTSSTNITTVNCLNECSLFVEIRERGKGENKRYWGIEMNDGRRMYLSLYWSIDVADHLLKNAALYYRTWKYWHAPMNHGFALCIVLAYGIYEECGEGMIEDDWKVELKKKKTYFEFREILSAQMLSYHPKNQLYPGDEKMRVVTSMPRKGRAKCSKRKEEGPIVSLAQLKKAKRYGTSRLCGPLDKLCNHISHIQGSKRPLVCAWCGLNTYSVCGKCKDDKGKPIPLHYNPKGEKTKGSLCFYHYHNDSCFGLGKNDRNRILGLKRSDWSLPDKDDIKDNASHISSLVDDAGL
jgi:hypothetical protein